MSNNVSILEVVADVFRKEMHDGAMVIYEHSADYFAKAILKAISEMPLDEEALNIAFTGWDKEDWPQWPDSVTAIRAYITTAFKTGK